MTLIRAPFSYCYNTTQQLIMWFVSTPVSRLFLTMRCWTKTMWVQWEGQKRERSCLLCLPTNLFWQLWNHKSCHWFTHWQEGILERCLDLFNAALHLGHKISGGLLMLIGHQDFEHLNVSLSSSETLWGKIHICCQEQWSDIICCLLLEHRK